MTELRKVNLRDTDDLDIDPAQLQEQRNIEHLLEEIIINQRIMISHFEILTDNVIKEEDLV